MKILFISDLYPVKSSEKTTPRTLYNFVKEWEELGHSVTVLKPNFLLNSFIRKKPFYQTGQYDGVFNANYLLPFMGNVKNRAKNIFREHYDIVIAHMPSGILFADKLGVPFVAGVHVSDLVVLTSPVYRIYFKPKLLKALRNARAIACRSYVIKDKLLSLYPEFEEKTFVAPSGVDEKYIINTFSSEINPQSLRVVTCANFKKRKNIDKLILALKGFDNIELTVIGDGKERKKLESLDKNVKFLGRLPNEKVLDEMRKSDIFVLPSVEETFGMVYLEAMASGCIVVCTKNDGIDGIIQDGVNGFTVLPDAGSIRNLFLKIKNCRREKLSDIRVNSLETIKQYTQKVCSKAYLDNIHKFVFNDII